MIGKLRTRTSGADVRRCVACGHAGDFGVARPVRSWRGSCPSCGCDFAERPPRTYAEMEGLVPTPSPAEARRGIVESESRLVERWIAVLFAGAVLFVAAACLTATVLAAF